MQIHQYNTGGLVKPFFANRGKNSLMNNLFYYRSLHVKCRTIVAHNNTVQPLEQFTSWHSNFHYQLASSQTHLDRSWNPTAFPWSGFSPA